MSNKNYRNYEPVSEQEAIEAYQKLIALEQLVDDVIETLRDHLSDSHPELCSQLWESLSDYKKSL
jgi:hypothetical protein